MQGARPNADYRQLLREELERRQLKNPRYSQGAFARALALTSGRLNEILHGKQGLSPKAAATIAERLGYGTEQRQHFLDLVRVSHSRDRLEREAARRRLEKSGDQFAYHSLSLDAFRLISEWWHLGILELMKTRGFESSPSWIASRLAVAESEIVDGLLRLKRLGLIAITGGKYVLKETDCCFPGGVPSRAGRRFHTQMLKLAARALGDQPLDSREFSTTLMAIDPKKVPYLKGKIAEFWKQMDAEMSRDGERTQVYCLGVQLFNASPGGAIA